MVPEVNIIRQFIKKINALHSQSVSNKVAYPFKTCRVDFTLGIPDWTVQLNLYTVHVVPARNMQLLKWVAV